MESETSDSCLRGDRVDGKGGLRTRDGLCNLQLVGAKRRQHEGS